MPTKEEIQEVLRSEMIDPSLPSSVFDEYHRRIKLLEEE